jgi:hypothetical protein
MSNGFQTKREMAADKLKETDMTQDEIIEMAIEAEFVSHGKPSDEESELFVCVDKDIYRFAKLVAAKEREACAKIVEENANRCGVDTVAWMLLASNAQAIRARGEA